MKQRSVDMNPFELVCHQLATTILINFFGGYLVGFPKQFFKTGCAGGKTDAGMNALPADTASDDAYNPLNTKGFSTVVAKWWQT